MDHQNTNYDTIIVGGRPAGATLAARLGQAGLRVLLLERATLPSAPAASCPAIYPATMRLLDEIGADEAAYARGTPRLRRMLSEVRDDFRVSIPLPAVHSRDYLYAIDRARFDAALWQTAAASPGVDALQGFAVTDLLRDGERVTGVAGRAADGASLRFSADCVVGADGRFSLVARKVGARSYDQRDDLPTTIYYAYWRNVAPYDDGGPLIMSYGSGRGYGYLFMDSADGMTCVALEGRSAVLEQADEKGAARYRQLLQAHPRIRRRLAHAEMVGEVRGMRDIGNLYREAGGPGWALVGDALHQKDPLDGQGIYDAVFTAKALSQAILDWKRGGVAWATAIHSYADSVRAETHPMYLATMDRVKRELYTEHPDWAYRSWLRWLADDPEYKRRIGLLLSRGIDPARWLPAPVMLGAIARGALGDLARLFSRRSRPNAIPAGQ
ncbi:MAG TPA: NAD(P)/FAD-dependent oxidoreductase [Roseiflexaceae bacterium]|nr:NAD(P)/FAD-dependent oxidoreductase [Roseiflexaceae bacterium]